MYSSEDLELFSISEYNERLLTDCRTDKRFQENLFPVPDGGNAEGISIEQFCSRNKVPYNYSINGTKKVQTECNQACLNC